MNITFITDHLNIEKGGANFSNELILRTLSQKGHDVRIVTLQSQDNVLPRDLECEVIEYEVQLRNPICLIQVLNRVLKNFDDCSDIFHVYKPTLLPFCGVLRERIETPIVGRLNNYLFCTNPAVMQDNCYMNCTIGKKIKHNSDNINTNLKELPVILHKHLSNKAVNNVDKLFAVSPAVQEIYSGAGIDGDLIQVIPNFYDPEFKQPTPYQDTTRKPVRLLYVGRITEVKGIDILIDSLEYLSKPVQVDIVGDGELMDKMIKRTQELKYSGDIEFHGWVNHEKLSRYYSDADIFVHPGRWPDPLPRTVMESMQHACVPVVSNVGGPPWMVGSSGLTFERNQPKELGRQIEFLSQSTEVIDDKKASAVKRIRQFDTETVIQQIEEEYISQIEGV